MTKITIRSYGGIGEVGRSCFLLEDRDNKILLDCGLKLIPKKPAEPPKILNDVNRPYEIDALILSHGHLDHSGFIPRLYEEGFRGKFILTPPTKEVLKILYNDMIKLQKTGKKETIFRARFAKEAIKRAITVNYKKWKKISDGIRIKFYDAGHVLGSSSILIDWKGTLILYSGDIKLSKSPLHDGANIPESDEIELLMVEATNSLRELPDRKIVARNLITEIRKTLGNGGKILIPTLSYGRAQEILYELVKNQLTNEYVVVLDGMLLRINKVYKKFLKRPWLSEETIEFCKENSIEWLDQYGNIIRGFRRNGGKREEIIKSKDPLIVLSTSGMLEGGPIHTYLRYAASRPENLMALVNYQVPGTLGRQIEEGAKRVEIAYKEGEIVEIELKLKVKKFEFSGHASPEELLKYVSMIKPRKILIIHSEPPSAKIFADKIKKVNSQSKIINRFDEETLSLAYENLFMEYEV